MWRYMVIKLTTTDVLQLEYQLNSWGKEGWELVSVCWHGFLGTYATAYFKRPTD